MRRLSLLPLLLLLALAACGPSLPPSTVNRPSSTSPSTVNGPSSTVSPTPTPSTPAYSTPDEPTPNEPTPDQTPAPAAPNLLEDTFGLTGDALQAFSGAETYITRAEDNTYFVTAFVRDPQTLDLHPARFTLIEDTFDIHPEINNPLGLYTVRAIDNNSRLVDLIWIPETQQFRLAYDLPQIYDGVNTDHPTFNPEAYDAAPTFSIDDIQSGFAVRNFLLEISQQLAQGKTLEQILSVDPQATRRAWTRLGGNSLFFEQLSDDARYVVLKAKGNDKGSDQQRYDNLTMKALPYGAWVEIDGERYFAYFIANFDPVDFDPDHPDQGADPTNIQNWKFMISIPTYNNGPFDPDSTIINWAELFANKNPLIPIVVLFGNWTYQDTHPLLAQLLAIPGNDASQLGDNPGYANIEVNVDNAMRYIEQLKTIELQPFEVPLPPQFSKIIFLFEVGVEP